MQVGGGVEIVRRSGGGEKYTMLFEEFGILCSAVTRVDVISFTSLHGLIVRVTFNTPVQFQLRSDINQIPVTELVFKCFIIQEGGEEPAPIPHVPTHAVTKLLAAWTGIVSSSATYPKKSSTSSAADNEYETQINIYDKTKNMSNPICPNALGLFKLTITDFQKHIASNPNFHNNVFIYLGQQLEAVQTRKIGILVMESIPSTYSALATYMRYSEYTTMCIHSSAVFCISFALAGFILIDAHLENWMVRLADADVFALDVDKTINIASQDSLDILSSYAAQTREAYTIPKSAQYLISPGIVKTIRETVRAIRDYKTAWPINLIHKLFVLGAISECLTNTQGGRLVEGKFAMQITSDRVGFTECKIGVILGKVYANEKGKDDVNFHKMSTILDINLDLDTYLRGVSSPEIAHIRSSLQKVSEYIAQRTMSRADTGRRGGSGSATRKPITRRQYKQYKTNRYRRGKKGNGKKTLKPKHLKRNRRRS